MSISKTLLWFSTVIAIIVKNAHGSSEITKMFPYLVGLATAEGPININKTVCSGTLVSPDFVLTSAHCTSLLQTAKIRVYSRKSAKAIKTRLAIEVYAHPSYNSELRLFDLSLVKLKRPFTHVNRFVKLSPKKFYSDQDMDCVIVGFNGTDGHSYKVPVRAKYGRSACQIPNSEPVLKYVLGYTWSDYLCTRTVGPPSSRPPRVPCDRSDPVLCGRNRQYGVFTYGYGADGTKGGGGADAAECGDPAVQGRSLLVNNQYGWIAGVVRRGRPEDDVEGWRRGATNATAKTTTTTTLVPTTTTTLIPKTTTTTTRGRPDDYPYLVRLQGLADEPTCGGTLISPMHVLTSAYCVTRMTEIHVTVTDRRQPHAADAAYALPTFDVPTLTADISIVVLRDSFNVSEYAQIADFPDPRHENETAEMSCMVVARMSEAPYHYQKSVEAKYGADACEDASVPGIQTHVDQTSGEFICGLYENYRLEEDAGNPLICNGMQYGLVSHGYQIEHPNANITKQMRFSSVKNYKQWITSVVAKTESQKAAGTRVQNHRRGLVTAVAVLLFSDVLRRL